MDDDFTTSESWREPASDPVLDAAAELFERHGYDETSMDAIAKHARCARSTVFRRYGSKGGILAAIVQAFFDGFDRRLRGERFAHDGGPEAAPVARVSGTTPVPEPGREVATTASARPGVESVLAAVDAYVRVHGSLARVALAAHDLPWLRPARHSVVPPLSTLARCCLGEHAEDPVARRMLLELLRQMVGRRRYWSVAAVDALASTLRELALRASMRPPSGGGSGGRVHEACPDRGTAVSVDASGHDGGGADFR